LKKIALEEAIIWPTQTADATVKVPIEYSVHKNDLLDITGKRLKEMDENNVLMQIISPTAGGLQKLNKGIGCSQIQKAQEVNDYMYNQIRSHPTRFKAFASLPTRHPVEAAQELERCVTQLGMLGALVNGPDTAFNEKAIFYDGREYDVLWKKFVDLDVPLYLHPTIYTSIHDTKPDPIFLEFFTEFPSLQASPWGFSFYLAQHVMRLIVSGVFDRFPKLKIILGHMGELLPWWAERFDHRICMYKTEKNLAKEEDKKIYKWRDFPLPRLSVSEYLKRNIYITTSGFFSDDALLYAIQKMGIERVMFSIDYPFESQSRACEWMDRVPLSLKNKELIAYKNAAKLLKISNL